MESNSSDRVLSEYKREKNLIMLEDSAKFFKEKIVDPVKKELNRWIKQKTH